MLRLLLLLLAGCGSPDPGKGGPTDDRPRKLLVVGWDGVRADVAREAATPNLDRLGAWGGVSFEASTHLSGPTVSAPGWMSIHTGQEPKDHGVLMNGVYDNRVTSWPTFLEDAHGAGLATYAAVVWGEVAYDIIGEPNLVEAHWGDEDSVGAWMIERIDDDLVDAAFVHQDAPDHAGHATGFRLDNPDYVDAVEQSDARLGLMLDAVEGRTDERWLVLVTTDHGGEGTGHGTPNAANQDIFLAVAEVGAEGGVDMTEASHLDVYPSAVRWLGLPHEKGAYPGTARVAP